MYFTGPERAAFRAMLTCAEEEEESSQHEQPAPNKKKRGGGVKRERAEPKTPKKLQRSNAFVGNTYSLGFRPAAEDDIAEPAIPDLGEYFSHFDLPEIEHVKICRAYANYLSSKDVRNRVRYSDQSQKAGTWAKKYQ